jgi:hypothetical protein
MVLFTDWNLIMAACIQCNNFNGESCTKAGFTAKCPTIHLECRGYSHTSKWDCLKNYDDECEHREMSTDPFSRDFCCKKNTYCNNKWNLK